MEAEEKASDLEGRLRHVSDSIEREKKRLNNELAQLKTESKFSVSRINAEVSHLILWISRSIYELLCKLACTF